MNVKRGELKEAIKEAIALLHPLERKACVMVPVSVLYTEIRAFVCGRFAGRLELLVTREHRARPLLDQAAIRRNVRTEFFNRFDEACRALVDDGWCRLIYRDRDESVNKMLDFLEITERKERHDRLRVEWGQS